MQNKLFSLGISFSALLISASALAQPSPQNTTKQTNLTRTEQRLADLIKAAAAQDLLEVSPRLLSTSTHRQASIPPLAPVQAGIPCSAEGLFLFPQEAHVEHYEGILALKNAIVTGPDQIDTHKAQILAQAYLGLGFAEEAINMAEHLGAPEQSAIIAMAHLVRGTTSDTQRKTFQVNATCFGPARIWQKLAQPDYEVFTEADFTYLNELPEQLAELLNLQLALKALQSNDLETAQSIFNDIKFNAKSHESYNPELSPYLLNDAVKLLDALLALKMPDEHEHNRAKGLLKSIAERDGLYRAQALQALTTTGRIYPEYMQDLDSVTQTFSGTPSGKQAQAKKISFLVSEHKFAKAVSTTKNNFEPDSDYYAQSVIIISQKMQTALSGTDINLQLGALNTLIIETGFFTHLADAKPLRHAGVNACIDLGLSELAPKILPVQLWGEFDDATLVSLALQEIKSTKFQIPQHIYQTPSLTVVELRKAFDNKNPRKAIKITSAHPKSKALQTAYAQAAWDNGYWSLAQDGLRKNSDGQFSNNLNLATTLSVLSPTLIKTHRPDGLAGQQALQSYLDSDLKIMRTYLMSDTQTPAGATNG